MNLIFWQISFIPLVLIGFLVYFLFTYFTKSPSQNPNRRKVEMYKLTGTLIRQRFTLLGRVGVTMVLLSPVAGAFIITGRSETIAQALFFDRHIPDFTWIYMILGFLLFTGLIFIIIGREFYCFAPEETVTPSSPDKHFPQNEPSPTAPRNPAPAKHPAPLPEVPPSFIPENPSPTPEAEPVPHKEFVTTMKDDLPPTNKL